MSEFLRGDVVTGSRDLPELCEGCPDDDVGGAGKTITESNLKGVNEPT